VFTARYALSPYIKQIRFAFKGLIAGETVRRILWIGSWVGPIEVPEAVLKKKKSPPSSGIKPRLSGHQTPGVSHSTELPGCSLSYTQ
jgi:hypothetical protein